MLSKQEVSNLAGPKFSSHESFCLKTFKGCSPTKILTKDVQVLRDDPWTDRDMKWIVGAMRNIQYSRLRVVYLNIIAVNQLYNPCTQ